MYIYIIVKQNQNKMKQLLESKEHNQILDHKLIGKTVSHMVTGVRVSGEVVAVFEDKYSITVCTKHEPVRWGESIYTEGSFSIRKCDNWIIGKPQIGSFDLTSEDFK